MLVTTGLLLTVVVGIRTASGQTPPFIGELTLEPGLTTGKCLTAASNTDGASVTIESCTYSPNQKWSFDGGSVKIFGGAKCLDVPGGSKVDGTTLQIWSCTVNNVNQKWAYTRDNRLAWNNNAGKCVDLPAGNSASGTRIAIYGCTNNNKNQVWDVGYNPSDPPVTSQGDQYGTNRCGTGSSQNSKCQTAWLNSAEDFCLFGPPIPNSTIGDIEHSAVAYCTSSSRGTRTIPNGALRGVHFVKAKDYVQVTGVGDFTGLGIRKGDSGGELDNRGADGRGNPAGGLVYGNAFGPGTQYHEWTTFISDSEFCFRACVGGDATRNCNHIYDVMGCYWNIPANYDANVFETCDADNDLPMGVYGTSTWHQGVSPTPPAHPAAPSSNCHAVPTVSVSPVKRSLPNGGSGEIAQGRRGRRERDGAVWPSATPF